MGIETNSKHWNNVQQKVSGEMQIAPEQVKFIQNVEEQN
jgi:hypothetical protein